VVPEYARIHLLGTDVEITAMPPASQRLHGIQRDVPISITYSVSGG
jgi:hypothetical protein